MDSRRCIRGRNVGLILMLRSKGYTIEQLMDKFHCSDTPLKRIFREYKGSWKPAKRPSARKLSYARITQIQWAYTHGSTVKEIAAAMEIHEKTVQRYVKGLKRMKWSA